MSVYACVLITGGGRCLDAVCLWVCMYICVMHMHVCVCMCVNVRGEGGECLHLFEYNVSG